MSLLQKLIKGNSKTQVEVAEAVGISQTHLSRIAQYHSMPSRELIAQLAEVLDVPSQALYVAHYLDLEAARGGADVDG